MRRMIPCLGLCLAVALVGCNTAGTTAGLNSKRNATADSSAASTSVVGSPEFSTSNKLTNPTKIHLAYAAWHEQAGDFSEARESYLKVLEKSPRDADALLGVARIDRAFGRSEEADLQLKKALKLLPKEPKVFVAIGQAHAEKHEWKQALENMQIAHKLSPYETIYEYHLAVVEANAGEISLAMEHFTRSVGKAEAHYNVGHILNEQGSSAEAEAHLVKALKLKPDLKQAQVTLTAIRSGNEDDVQPASHVR